MYASAHIIVKGMVQGVGFRFYAIHEARSLNLCGFVRNCADGSVESEAEGPRELVEEYIKALHRGPAFSHVTAMDVSWGNYESKYKDFRIL